MMMWEHQQTILVRNSAHIVCIIVLLRLILLFTAKNLLPTVKQAASAVKISRSQWLYDVNTQSSIV